MGMAYALMGDKENANKAMLRPDELLAGKPPSPLTQACLAEIAYLCGDTSRINETITRLQNHPAALAGMHYRLGEFDKLFENLEKAFEERSPLMAYMVVDRRFWWRKIKDDPRYLSLLERMNFPNEKL